MKIWLKKLLLCHLLPSHNWTCAATEGIAPTSKQLRDGVAGFLDYATTYCRRCGRESESSKEAKERNHGRA